MKKLIVPFFVMLFAITSINAQQRIGVKLDYGINTIQSQNVYLINHNREIEYNLSLTNVSGSQSAGIVSIFDFGNLFLQPEFIYSSYSLEYSVENFKEFRNSNSETTIQESIKQFDIPVYAGFKYNKFRIGAGPVFHLSESITSDISDFENIDLKPTKFSAGLQAGVGIDLNYVLLDIKYETHFNQAADHITYNNHKTGLKSNMSGLKIGLAIVLGN